MPSYPLTTSREHLHLHLHSLSNARAHTRTHTHTHTRARARASRASSQHFLDTLVSNAATTAQAAQTAYTGHAAGVGAEASNLLLSNQGQGQGQGQVSNLGHVVTHPTAYQALASSVEFNSEGATSSASTPMMMSPMIVRVKIADPDTYPPPPLPLRL